MFNKTFALQDHCCRFHRIKDPVCKPRVTHISDRFQRSNRHVCLSAFKAAAFHDQDLTQHLVRQQSCSLLVGLHHWRVETVFDEHATASKDT